MYHLKVVVHINENLSLTKLGITCSENVKTGNKELNKLIFTHPRKHNNFICTNTSRVEGVHPARDENIIYASIDL